MAEGCRRQSHSRERSAWLQLASWRARGDVPAGRVADVLDTVPLTVASTIHCLPPLSHSHCERSDGQDEDRHTG